jgi:ribonuclease BN (tRNA processing enzyme)
MGEQTMGTLHITILGNGGCLNKGLPYNAFVLNDSLLVETPPDIMLSLQTVRKKIDTIDAIYISHLHGDHTFGLPFFLINKWLLGQRHNTNAPLTIFGPDGIDTHAKLLTKTAFTTNHPCYAWLEQHVQFTRINQTTVLPLPPLELSCVRLQHLVETYGFIITHQQQTLFAYIADTVWCRPVEQILAKTPDIVLMDMNGINPKVHMSLDEVKEKGLPLTKGDTRYYGTHLAEEFDTPEECISCAKQGDEILIPYGEE